MDEKKPLLSAKPLINKDISDKIDEWVIKNDSKNLTLIKKSTEVLTKRISLSVSDSLYKKMKIQCIKKNTTLQLKIEF
jgi:hypothetical protein